MIQKRNYANILMEKSFAVIKMMIKPLNADGIVILILTGVQYENMNSV